MITSPTFHLVRHAETASYHYDAGLTRRGRTQARERAKAIADALHDGGRIDIVYAPTERTRETARLFDEVLRQDAEHRSPRMGSCVQDCDFRNLQVTVGDKEFEPTQARRLMTNGRSWVREADAFGPHPIRWATGCQLPCCPTGRLAGPLEVSQIALRRVQFCFVPIPIAPVFCPSHRRIR
jgi:broad specificity phosphatase PhoE